MTPDARPSRSFFDVTAIGIIDQGLTDRWLSTGLRQLGH
jgi:hypothetical protein